MALILNIDTSLETASASIAEDGVITGLVENTIQKDHATFLHVSIAKLFLDAGKKITDTDAIAVTIGPGSYTGLRVGMASAKGFAYALNKPLINIGTLELIARSVKNENTNEDGWYCPVIDARRMEVFTALYDEDFKEIVTPYSLVVESTSFDSELAKRKIYFAGTGVEKTSTLIQNNNAVFITRFSVAIPMASRSWQKFELQEFTDLAHSQPLYVKEFYDNK